MTKCRAPFSAEEALYRVANFIGWDVAARIAGREERTVRQWSDPDEDRHCPQAIAVQLDIAWRAAGGVGLPFHDAHLHHLQAAAPPPVMVIDLAAQYRVVNRECFEFDDAIVDVLVSNDPAATLEALQELDDVIVEKHRMRALLVATLEAPVMAVAA